MNDSVLREGTLVRWDQAKGFGFIKPRDGGKDVFVHISALPSRLKPEVGMTLSFTSADDSKGRGPRVIKAVAPNAGLSGPSERRTTANPSIRRGDRRRQRNTKLQPIPMTALTILVAALTLLSLAGAATFFLVSPIPLVAYVAASLAAFLAYARDKLSAIKGTWRVPESTLHLLELLGGWPGAYLAQQSMRHKTIKLSYQLTYWAIVCLHVGFWTTWFVSPSTVTSQLAALIPSLST